MACLKGVVISRKKEPLKISCSIVCSINIKKEYRLFKVKNGIFILNNKKTFNVLNKDE